MIAPLIFLGIVILLCVLLNNASIKIGMPVLLAFILLGIFLGNFVLQPEARFNNFKDAETVCTIALIFIMFYGGFGTNWKAAKGTAVESALLASLGVIVTAAMTGILCHYLLKWGWIESLLLGSVVSSTDAASVFSILRARKLGLKNNTAPILEMESGSNDPFSYMMTIVMLSLMGGHASGGDVAVLLLKQLGFGVGCAVLIAQGAIWIMKKVSFATSGFDSLFVLAIAILSYAIPSAMGGNGYLSSYMVGIILGNAEFQGKKQLVNFFDGVTGLMQVVIFFLLGLLARPNQLLSVLIPAIILFLAITLVARPASIFSVLGPFKKYGVKQMSLISFVGLRGAASIVFAIMAVAGNDLVEHDIFNIVFVIVLLSISIQGTLLPYMAKKLDMIDTNTDVMKTFSDFADGTDLQFSQLTIAPNDPWNGKTVIEMSIPRNILLCLVVKQNGERYIPHGKSILEEGDTVIMCSCATSFGENIHITEHPLSKNSKWAGKRVREYPASKGEQLVMIRRGDDNIVPNGETVFHEGDILFINKG